MKDRSTELILSLILVDPARRLKWTVGTGIKREGVEQLQTLSPAEHAVVSLQRLGRSRPVFYICRLYIHKFYIFIYLEFLYIIGINV